VILNKGRMTADSKQRIVPANNVRGSVRLPGDKSISHRYAMLAAIASGSTKLENFSSAADCASTLGCVESLGARVTSSDSKIEIEGTGGELRAPSAPLDCGNSGSTMRMLSGIVAGYDFKSEMIGDESLSRRPMRRIIDPLTQMGARIAAAEGDRPPLRIEGKRLRSITYEMPVASAQVKSCVLLAGLRAPGTTTVIEKVATRDHTELALRAFGVRVEQKNGSVSLQGLQKLNAIEAYVPGDLSTATFFLCAAAMFPESNLIFDHVLLNPTRAGVLDVLATMGLKVAFLKVEELHGETIGTVQVKAGKLTGAVISGALSAALIDELPMLAAMAAYTRDGIEVRDARELRVKESDRIAAVSENLRRMGVHFEEGEDGWKIPGQQQPQGAELESFGDHRIAMAFAISALRAQGESYILNADAVAVSFPQFFTTLESIVER
jgi:3-phosphoshikimate 1-carboxyvinyltransferase